VTESGGSAEVHIPRSWDIAAEVSGSEDALSILRMMRFELGARGRVFRAWEAVERGSRTQAIMVWEGQRRKRRERMPWPMPGVG
jgi:hypothetical protein